MRKTLPYILATLLSTPVLADEENLNKTPLYCGYLTLQEIKEAPWNQNFPNSELIQDGNGLRLLFNHNLFPFGNITEIFIFNSNGVIDKTITGSIKIFDTGTNSYVNQEVDVTLFEGGQYLCNNEQDSSSNITYSF